MVFWGSEMMFFEKIMGLLGVIIAEMAKVEIEGYILSVSFSLGLRLFLDIHILILYSL